jgi:hypothetical protein
MIIVSTDKVCKEFTLSKKAEQNLVKFLEEICDHEYMLFTSSEYWDGYKPIVVDDEEYKEFQEFQRYKKENSK